MNVAGMSVAFTAALIICLWVNDELSVDKFHEKDERLFQVVSNITTNGIVSMREPTPIGMAHILSTELPGIEFASTVTPLRWFPKFIVKKENIKIKCEGKFVSRDFLKMFSYPLIAGHVNDGLLTKQSILLSETTAKKLFGTAEAAVGKTLPWELTDIKHEGPVTGVFADVPANSTDQFEIIFPIDMLREIMGFAENDMNAFGPLTFITVPENTDIADLNRKIDRLIKSKRADLKADSFYVVKYSSRYLYGNFENGFQQSGRMTYVKIFSLVGLIIVTLACINFINISTAENESRIKEVGVRKIIGAPRSSLCLRNIGESIVVCFTSLILSLCILSLLLPSISNALEKQLSVPLNVLSVTVIFTLTIAIGLLAGI
jgi:putative ABC transport system permease protein